MSSFNRTSPTRKEHVTEIPTSERLINSASRLKYLVDDLILKQPQMPVELTTDFISRIIDETVKAISENPQIYNSSYKDIRIDVDFTEEMNNWISTMQSNMFRNRSHLVMCNNPDQVEYLLSLNAVLDFLRNYFKTEDIAVYSKHISQEAGALLRREQGITIRVYPKHIAEGIDKYLYGLKADRTEELMRNKLEKAFGVIEEIQQKLNNLDNKLGESLGLVLVHLEAIKTSVVKKTTTGNKSTSTTLKRNGN